MITDLLLDVNIIVDVCAERHPYFARSVKALDKAIGEGVRLWIYTGSVQTLEYVTANELRRAHLESNTPITVDQAHKLARKILALFSKDRHWLTALPEDGMVFEEEDPEDAQLHRAVTRLGKGARLLTRDEETLKSCPQAISPGDYLDHTSKGTQIPFIDLAAQQDRIRPNLEKNIFAVIRHGRYILGPEVQELEEKLSSYTGARHAITCSSGTDALLMALMAYDVGPGDAVFTTPFTFIATAEAISFLGATPVFVDIDPRTFNIDPNQLELAIEALMSNNPSIHPLPSALSFEPSALSPKGIITVDLFGLPADYHSINAIAREYGLFVIEDAAQSFGAEYHGKKACTLADIGCTSFFPAKPLGCYGDGGAVFTDDDDLADKMRSIRVHGKGFDKYDNIRIGMNARMDTLQAAILLAKMEIYPREVQLRQEVAKRYSDLLSTQSSALSTPFIPEGMKSAWAQYTVRAKDSETRRVLMDRLKAAGIPSVVYYPKPLHLQTAFAHLGYQPGDFPLSEEASREVLSLPFGPYMSDEDVGAVTATLSA